MLKEVICPVCQNEFRQKFNTQRYCSYYCAQISRRVVERPSSKELEELVNNNPWETVAKMFGVSSYTIRKWVKYYGLEIVKPKPQQIPCPHCGKTFKQKHRKQKYCSITCSNRDKYK